MDSFGSPDHAAFGGASDRHSGRSRALVVWCPDWPAVAASREAGLAASESIGVFHANRVQACTAAARSEGVHLGQRRRDAQARCPELLIARADPDRDARLFEPLVQAMESIAPGIEVLRPGLIACAVRGPRRYFGTEIVAAERIVDIVEALDVECRVGIADALATAVLAARRSAIVPPGRAAEFCDRLPVTELSAEPAISPPERELLTDLLIRLGITTCGAFAALPEAKVATRFGADAVVAHRLARGHAERGVSRRKIPEDLGVEQACDPPLDRVDTAAFAGRALAERFHAQLADAGLACTRLSIVAITDRDARLARVWRCAKPLTAAATADRLRWQLDGWLTAGDGPGSSGITMLRLEPLDCLGAGFVQYGLWGSDGKDDQRAGWAFARVQGLLGPDSVLVPLLSGGRGPAERIEQVAWGDEHRCARSSDDPWPGALPAPTPARVFGSDQVSAMVLDRAERPVRLGDRGLLTGVPHWLAEEGTRQRVLAWAGPWLLDERWWSTTRRTDRPQARVQVVVEPGQALVLNVDQQGCRVEGVYD